MLLSGCTAWLPPWEQAKPAPQKIAVTRPAPTRAKAPAAPATGTGDTARVAAARRTAPSPTPSQMTPAQTTPAAASAAAMASSDIDLVGMDESQLQALMGPPSSQQDLSPGKEWLYRHGTCTVDLTLYPDIKTQAYRVLSYEVTSDNDTGDRKRYCLADLRSVAQAK
ncbi:hypothetical protein [Nitrospirillum viridazoti]|uniref:Uncharacterized protein n=1 Tax=Nitrospirillum viridazoti CBAmc TaxID=1441467 RepID=A0A248JUU8_9PROT|nr:hypothetical protein [Nitrospirillum amazonense]ASG22502.1 hypothetical protein Y958_16330 [Nitrospirillum amazonense CBAmc]TWB42944.1 hypothetical protein FBZ91_102160 [Nitrospirillum amazonense]